MGEEQLATNVYLKTLPTLKPDSGKLLMQLSTISRIDNSNYKGNIIIKSNRSLSPCIQLISWY